MKQKTIPQTNSQTIQQNKQVTQQSSKQTVISSDSLNEFQFKIAGEAGFGIMSTGLMFSRTCARHGYHIFDYTEYPSLIRGGHNTYQVRVCKDKINSQVKTVDILVAFNLTAIESHKDELRNGSVILYDKATTIVDTTKYPNFKFIDLSWNEAVSKAGISKVMINNVALGAAVALVKGELNILNSIIDDTFASKGQKVCDENKKAAKLGYDVVTSQKQNLNLINLKLTKVKAEERMVITGNEAMALGAVAGDCHAYIAYPMTPATSILHNLANFAEEAGIVVKHAEDEISVANMAIGCAFAGGRTICGTSGGGFCLMTEAVGLSAITETPVVFIDVQRPGPATGLPTWTGQGDLKLALGAGQGEFPRIILSAGDVKEAFELTIESLNLAEKFQSPVVLLSDKYLAESHATQELFDLKKVKIDRGQLIFNPNKEFKRYEFTNSGVSNRALPGSNAVIRSNSDEHDEHGFSVDEKVAAQKMLDKRMRKLDTIKKEMSKQKVYGNLSPIIKDNFLIISTGANKGPILDAMKMLESQGIKNISYYHITHLSPFNTEDFTSIFNKCKNYIMIENNQTGMVADWIQENTCIKIKNRMLRYDGRPFYPEDIVQQIKGMIE